MVLTKKQTNNFWAKVMKTDGCWYWNAALGIGGYGKFNIGGDCYPAHRISLLLTGIDIELRKKEKGAGGIIVMHTCDCRNCVNPNHLKVATQKENMADAKLKGRKWNGELTGENNPRAKLTVDNVNFIRNSEMRYKELADIFDVCVETIGRVKNNNSWIAA